MWQPQHKGKIKGEQERYQEEQGQSKSLPATPTLAAIAAAAPAAPPNIDAFSETGAEITICSVLGVDNIGMSPLGLGFAKLNFGSKVFFCWKRNHSTKHESAIFFAYWITWDQKLILWHQTR